MIKEISYKEKFLMLKNWMPTIIESIKKDLKNEHLKKDWAFVKQYFPGKNPNKLTAVELTEAYLDVIENGENVEELSEFISNRWLLKHTDLYHYFEKELSQVSPDFSELEVLEAPKAIEIMEGGTSQFGALNTYIFSVLNSVVFPKEVYDTLAKRAESAIKEAALEVEVQEELKSLSDMQRSYEQQLARQKDKYEKKLLGLQKKYAIDTESLKKQVVTLQRKLATHS